MPTSANDCVAGRDTCLKATLKELARIADDTAKSCSHDAIFARAYLRMTQTYGWSRDIPGYYQDVPFANHQDAVFAKYYTDAYYAYQSGDRASVPEAWRIAFDASRDKRVSGTGSLLLGMNAHINRDLPFVLAAVGLVAPDGSSRKPDYDAVEKWLYTATEPLLAEFAARFDPTADDANDPFGLSNLALFQLVSGVARDTPGATPRRWCRRRPRRRGPSSPRRSRPRPRTAAKTILAIAVLRPAAHVVRSPGPVVRRAPRRRAAAAVRLRHGEALRLLDAARVPDAATPTGSRVLSLGRRQELAVLRRTLGSARLVTLTGPGGIGKTTLARAAAADHERARREDTWAVDLADLVDPDLLGHSVAGAFGVLLPYGAAGAGDVAAAVADRAGLLVLDGCEAMLDAAVELVAVLLATAPRLRVLATSQRQLGVTGEVVVPVGPLAADEAQALFAARAAAALPSFRLTEDNAAAVASSARRSRGCRSPSSWRRPGSSCCRRRASSTGCADRQRLLAKGARDAPPRQRSLRASLEASNDLCTPDERLLWARLSVFTGGFPLEAAEAVCAGDGIDGGGRARPRRRAPGEVGARARGRRRVVRALPDAGVAARVRRRAADRGAAAGRAGPAPGVVRGPGPRRHGRVLRPRAGRVVPHPAPRARQPARGAPPRRRRPPARGAGPGDGDRAGAVLDGDRAAGRGPALAGARVGGATEGRRGHPGPRARDGGLDGDPAGRAGHRPARCWTRPRRCSPVAPPTTRPVPACSSRAPSRPAGVAAPPRR